MFAKADEASVSKVIIDEFYEELKSLVSVDCVICGAGPAGLVCGYFLAKAGKSVLLVEQSKSPGGGAWSGGYMMNVLTVRSPGNEVLEEIGLELKEHSKGLFSANAIQVCARLIDNAISAGAKILNLTYVEDIVVRDDKVEGVVINWAPIKYLPRTERMLDPICIESKVVLDATGHDAFIARMLEKRNMLKMAGEGPMHIERAEDILYEKTGQVFDGLFVAGMSVCAVYGIPRMGPTFGGMYMSGKKAAELILKKLG